MAKLRTHYDSLNVQRTAPLSVIRAAYKALSQKYHPDKFAGGSEQALRIMKIINGAYAVLSDADKRAAHDLWIVQQEKEQPSIEAPRIMTAKAAVAPPVISQESPPPGAIGKSQKPPATGNKKSTSPISWIAGIAAVVGLALTASFVYEPESTPRANKEVDILLSKAQELVEQGRVVIALPLYLQLAEQGNADAQFRAGLIYANGQGALKDDKQAVDWLGKAALQGHSKAQTKLGFMYATGKGVVQNYNTAVYWCYMAAIQGDVTAQYNLGLMYAKGQGAAQDHSLAVSWYSKAAAQGDARAQYNLGDMYENGVGVAKDNQQAADLYRKAAQQGLAAAAAALKKVESGK